MKGEGEGSLEYTDWIYIGILAVMIATLLTFVTADLNASMCVWVCGWAILCVLYPIAHWLEKRKRKHSEKPSNKAQN